MTTVEIYAHAEVLPVRARLVSASGTGHLETLILRAVAKGVSDIDDIAAMFGISARLALDVVGDLWREGRLALNVDDVREALQATTKALDELKALDDVGSLPSSYSVVDAQSILLDKLTGRALPMRGSRLWAPDPTLVIDLAPGDPTRANLEQQAIDDAVAASLRDRHRGTDDRMDSYRVVGTTLAPMKTEATYRYLPYVVDVTRSASGELSIAVTDERIPLAERELATKRLSGAVHSVPRPSFVRRLQNWPGVNSHHQPRGLDQLMGDFERAVDALQECAPANRQTRHDQLVASASEIFGQLGANAEHQMTVKLLQTEGEHVDAVHSVIRGAKHQLVFAVPWITENGIRTYLEDLEAALARGVRVIILWGINARGETLPEPVTRHLIALQRRALAQGRGGQLHYPTVPSHLHAKLIVADDRTALVSSRNFFSTSRLGEVGVRLEALRDQRCPVTEELLHWAHSMAPSQNVADQISTDGKALGTGAPPPQLPPLPLPRFSGVLPGASTGAPEVTLWLAGWKAARGRLLDLLLHPRMPTVTLVIDGYHRALALESFRKARRRVVITSHGLSADALTSGMVLEARQAASSGTAVTMVFCTGKETGATARIDELKAPLAHDLTPPVIRSLRNWHGKVLVFDDSSVIGSYNFLSRDSTKSRGRSTGELSVRIDDSSVADLLAAALQRQDQVEPHRGSERPEIHDSSAEATLAAQDFLDSLTSPAQDTRQARSLFTVLPPESILQVLRDAAPAACERALALLVATEPAGATWATWADELVERTWSRGAWWIAATIARSLPKEAPAQTSASLFETVLAILSRSESAIAHLNGTSLTVDQRDAAALFGATQLLATGTMGLFDPLSTWEPDCTPDVARIVSLVRSVTVQHGFVGDRIGRRAKTDAATGRSEQAWFMLDHAVSELRRYKPNTPPGNQLLSHLFGAGGEMDHLATIVKAQDFKALRSWANQFDETDSRWVTRASKRAGLVQAIKDSQRNSFVKKHDVIWQAVKRVLTQGETSLDDTATGQLKAFEDQLLNLVNQVSERPGPSGQLISTVKTTVAATIAGEATPEVPGATRDDWRFPTLLREEWTAEHLDDDGIARAVATDVYAHWDAPTSIRSILQAGEYQLAEELMKLTATRTCLPTTQADLLEGELRDARRQLASDVAYAIAQLRSRADCAGVSLPDNEPRPSQDSIARRVDVEQELALWQEQVESRIREATQVVEQAIAEQLKSLSNRETVVIRDLIEAGDLVAARSMADEPEQPRMRVLEPPPRTWPQRHASLQQILFHLRNEERGAPTLREFVPPPEDKCGTAFLDSLEGLEAGDVPVSAITDYVSALEGLISTMRHPNRSLVPNGDTPQTGTFRTELAVAHPESLPPFVWPGGTIPVAVGDEDIEGTLIRISLRVAASKDEPEVVDIAKALSLLAPISSDRSLTETRATRFLRLICPQMDLQDLVDVRGLGDLSNWRDRSRLWALLDVLGFHVSDTAKASLLAVAGRHPHLMWHLIDTALRERHDSPDIIKTSTWDTSRLMSRPDFDDLVARAVGEDLTTGVELAVLLAVAIWKDEDGIQEPLVRMALQEAGVAAPGQTELNATLDALVQKRYLDSPAPGLFRMQNTPIGRALARHDPEGLLAAAAQRIAETPGTDLTHHWAARFRIAYDGSQLSTWDMQDPNVPCDLSRWAHLLAHRNWTPMADPEGNPPITVAPIIDADLRVHGPAVAVVGTIDNLLGNAVAALLASSTDNPAVVLTARDNRDDTVTVEVADNGPGLPKDVETDLRAGTLRPSGGRRLGLARLLKNAKTYGWTVTTGRDDVLGGALISIRLPKAH